MIKGFLYKTLGGKKVLVEISPGIQEEDYDLKVFLKYLIEEGDSDFLKISKKIASEISDLISSLDIILKIYIDSGESVEVNKKLR